MIDIVPQNSALTHFDAARRELALASTVDEVKSLRDKAEVMRAYLRQQGESLEMQNRCAEIKLRAERKLGVMLAETPKHPPGPEPIDRLQSATDPPTLSDLGIEKTQSHRWQAIAAVPEDMFEEYIATAAEITSADVYRIARVGQRQAQREETAALATQTEAPTGQYRTIVIDPPWEGADSGDDDPIGRGDPRYSTMTIEEIAALPVPALMEPGDCHVYLWVTNRTLKHGLTLFDAWEIRYITMLTWCKPSIGVGRYYRNNTEHVLFGVAGSRLLARADVGTWFEASRQGPHSTKPAEFYQLVQSCSPGPMLDMFARSPRDGWSVWGAQANG